MSGFGTSSLGASSSQRPTGNNLSTLLLQANGLSRNVESELPQLRYGLDEIERLSESIAGKSKRGKQSADGHNLLSNLGVNTSQLAHSISALPSSHQENGSKRRRAKVRAPRLDTLPDAGPSYGAGDMDVGAWGRNWHETIILSGIEYQRQRTVKNFNDQFQQRLLANWEADKARILQDELGVTDDEISRLSGGGLGSSTLTRSTLGGSVRKFPQAHVSTAPKEGEFIMHTKQVRYNGVIQDLNRNRLSKTPFELAQALGEATKGDLKNPQLQTSYQILAHLLHEPSLSDAQNGEPIGERQYASVYLSDGWHGRKGELLRERLVAGGRRFLEKDFESHMDDLIARHPKEAQLGGKPGIENKVRAYVDVLFRDDEKRKALHPESIEGKPLYAQVYFLLRAGYPTEAQELLSNHQNSLSRSDIGLPGLLQTYLSHPNRRIPPSQLNNLRNDWNNIRNKDTADQYKVALYKIIGRFDLTRKSVKVATTTEDWVWFNLTLLRESKDDAPNDRYDLAMFSEVLTGFGNDRFDQNGQKPLSWFNLLLYAGQFEAAVAYLYNKPQLRMDAVHFAIALQYYGLLRVSDPDDQTFTEIRDLPAFNFSRAIKTYISPLARVEPQSALQYAYLVALGSENVGEDVDGDRQKTVAMHLVRDVVLASRAWGKLLGSVRADGTKQPGMIERDFPLLNLSSTDDYFQQVVLSAANQSAVDSSLIDSIELYHLAGAPDKVIETVNRALGQSLSLPNAAQQVTRSNDLGISGAFGGADDLFGLATRVYEVYTREYSGRGRLGKSGWETLGVLLQLKKGLKEYAENRPEMALRTFKSTGILPLDPDPSSLQRSTTAFQSLLNNESISSLDEVIITTMKCLHQLAKSVKESAYGDPGRMGQLEEYKGMARVLVMFGSGMRLRLGADVYRQLSSMSAFF